MPAGIDEHDLRASLSADGQGTGLLLADPPGEEAHARRGDASAGAAGHQDERRAVPRRPAHRAVPRSRAPAEPYWEEALQRDPGDVRVNTALGIDCFKKARFAEAEKLLRKAIERLTDKYTSAQGRRGDLLPRPGAQGTGQDRRGVCHALQSHLEHGLAIGRLPALAEIAATRGDMPAALRFAEQSLQANALNIRALTLKAAVLRHLGRSQEALRVSWRRHRASAIRWTCG